MRVSCFPPPLHSLLLPHKVLQHGPLELDCVRELTNRLEQFFTLALLIRLQRLGGSGLQGTQNFNSLRLFFVPPVPRPPPIPLSLSLSINFSPSFLSQNTNTHTHTHKHINIALTCRSWYSRLTAEYLTRRRLSLSSSSELLFS